MTKRRSALSIEIALSQIAGQLPGGFERAASLVDRQPRTVRNWSDPETPEGIPLDCAIKLDLAFQEAGGDGAPLFEAYANQLELAEATRFADRHTLLRQAEAVTREGGEAHAALIRAAQPDASANDKANAHREACEAYEALKRVIPLLAEQPP